MVDFSTFIIFTQYTIWAIRVGGVETELYSETT